MAFTSGVILSDILRDADGQTPGVCPVTSDSSAELNSPGGEVFSTTKILGDSENGGDVTRYAWDQIPAAIHQL